MRTLTTKATEITNFALFHEYVHNCDNKQLMVLAIEADYANGHGYFKPGSYCNDVKDTISTNNPRTAGVGTILDMCICIGQELIERVVHGTFDENEHGRWIKRMSTPDSLKCSVCGNNHEYETTYCPHCGRKMDSDAERRCEK